MPYPDPNMNLQSGQAMPNFAQGWTPDDPNKEQALRDYFGRVSAMNPQQQQVKRRRVMAEALRAPQRQPQMRRTPSSTGGIQQAAHPLEFVADLARQGVGAYQEYKANKAEDQYGAGRREALGDLQGKVFPQQQQQQQQQQRQYGGAGGTGYGRDY